MSKAEPLTGLGVSAGIAVGPVARMAGRPELPAPAPVSDVDGEVAAAAAALDTVAKDLTGRADGAAADAAAILEAQSLMAADPALADSVAELIRAGSDAAHALTEAFETYREMLAGAGGYLAERVADLDDVRDRAVAAVLGRPMPGVPHPGFPYVLVADDLAPADTVGLDPAAVLALVTERGSPTSHTAILARAQGIPAVVGVGAGPAIADGTRVVLDAASGVVIVDPSEAQLADARARIAERATRAAAPIADGALADGTRIALLANLGSPSEAAAAIALGAEGVGLFRTEFLFLGARTAPTVAEQQARYAELLRQFPGKRVVVRVLDAGADKPLEFLRHAHEENPALGLRGLRALRAAPQVLADQLQALKNAADETDAELWVMAPMVADSAETEYFVEAGRTAGLNTVGVMAEIPSLALVADQVVRLADFVSIGTNDLTQYTLAADRTLGAAAAYQDPWHPAVLRLVKMLGDAGAAAGKPVGICGEAASDPRLAVVLVGLGATSLSMAPVALADVRAELAGATLERARAKAVAALAADSADGARAAAAAV